MSATAPPDEVLSAFLGLLNRTATAWEQPLVPVVRGSWLLRHWLGDDARPAADIDLECFVAPRRARPRDDEDEDFDDEFEPEAGRFGPDGEYESLVDYGKAMCRYSANESRGYRWRKGETAPEVEFAVADPPAGGVSLWTYGTPGERYFAGWTMPASGESGLLQIDIAESTYTLADIATTVIEVELDGKTVDCPAYAPETLLAAKLSWLLRSLTRDESTGAIVWKGEPKDLFDAHLLLTRVELTPEPFQKSLGAIGAQDKLDWNSLATLMTAGHTLKDADFPNRAVFREAHKDIVDCGPAEMIREVAEKLEPLLGDFYPKDEMPFILAANANKRDETPLLVYADWLDDHDRPNHSAFVRAFTRLGFHDTELTPAQRAETVTSLKDALDLIPMPWLFQFFSSKGAVDVFRKNLESPVA